MNQTLILVVMHLNSVGHASPLHPPFCTDDAGAMGAAEIGRIQAQVGPVNRAVVVDVTNANIVGEYMVLCDVLWVILRVQK